jgi:cytochrome b involved in lipid metabolism
MSKNKITLVIAVLVIFAIVCVYIISNNSKTVVKTPEQNATQTQTATTTIKSFTLAEVTKHNSSTDCWTTINNKVYEVTSWIAKHPGGSSAIISLCGKDGSPAFNGKHGGQARPESELAGFEIGILK